MNLKHKLETDPKLINNHIIDQFMIYSTYISDIRCYLFILISICDSDIHYYLIYDIFKSLMISIIIHFVTYSICGSNIYYYLFCGIVKVC